MKPEEAAVVLPASSWRGPFSASLRETTVDGLEQTFHLPVMARAMAMAFPDRAPLRVLDRLTGRTLTTERTFTAGRPGA